MILNHQWNLKNVRHISRPGPLWRESPEFKRFDLRYFNYTTAGFKKIMLVKFLSFFFCRLKVVILTNEMK